MAYNNGGNLLYTKPEGCSIFTTPLCFFATKPVI